MNLNINLAKKIKFFIFLFFLCFSDISPAFKKNILISDDQAYNLVCDILKKLCKASNRPPIKKIFFILSSDINAFATEQDSIYINTGIFIKLKSVDELIGILAHELGHIAGGHIYRMNTELKTGTLAVALGALLGGALSIASGGIAPLMLGSLIGEGYAMNSAAAFTLTHEKEADAFAYNTLKSSNLNPQGLIDAFNAIQKTQFFEQDPYFKTHPSSKDRIKTIQNYKKLHPYTYETTIKKWQDEFLFIKSKFIAYVLSNLDAVKKINYLKNINIDAYNFGNSVIYAKKGNYKKALSILSDLDKKYASNPYIEELEAQFYFENGQINEAITKCEKALKQNPLAFSIRLLYAQALINTDNASKISQAIAILEKIVIDNQNDYMTWLLLCIAYNKQSKNIKADLAQAHASLLIGDFKLAISRSQRVMQKGSKDQKDEAQNIINDANEILQQQ